MSTSIDYSRPLASLMKDSAFKIHDEVASSPGAKLLGNGRLPKEEYVRYLMILWHIYNALERALEQHAGHPVLEPTYNPTLLARAPSLSSDIAHLLQVPESQWHAHPIHSKLMADASTPLFQYLQRIQEITSADDPSPLLAHSYVRYLGDLSGGQTIRHILCKAYGLDEAAGFGVSFYAFKELHSAKPASQGEMKRIKEWFRRGMDLGGEKADLAVKTALVQETQTAFVLNANLLNMIEADESPESPKEEGNVQSREVAVPTVDSMYSISSVIAVVAAVCISHFLLVIGGFTGERGYNKLLAALQWFTALWEKQ